ncbi:hypothetical protein [Paenibacillus sp. N3.4]|uniref:hypothetical protein n=1 Tax=Paenibacillus sp. N3.4 TaxID=2603222 RepID=UPI0021C46EE9|nr:hypothetical protein [Paenibacillus sp. N3.4]
MATNGEYGCMGDLGMHVLHLPMRFGWKPRSVRALLSKVVQERLGRDGMMVPCETWDNAILACDVKTADQQFPMNLSTKRIAPGHANTWFIRIQGTQCSADFSTKNPKQIASLPYTPGGEQSWHGMSLTFLNNPLMERLRAVFSNSASPTRFCKCGPHSAMKSLTAAR